jgi:hypothetical protein
MVDHLLDLGVGSDVISDWDCRDVNWIHAFVIWMPRGIMRPVKRMPTIWSFLPARIRLRSVLVSLTVRFPIVSSASSLDAATRRSTTEVPGGGGGWTMIVVESDAVSAPSLAVNIRTYVPAWPNDACVSTAFAFWKVTVPGPLETLHVTVTAAGGLGRPSSVTVPSSEAPKRMLAVAFGPASTTGAVLIRTVTVMESDALKAPSFAVSRST